MRSEELRQRVKDVALHGHESFYETIDAVANDAIDYAERLEALLREVRDDVIVHRGDVPARIDAALGGGE